LGSFVLISPTPLVMRRVQFASGVCPKLSVDGADFLG